MRSTGALATSSARTSTATTYKYTALSEYKQRVGYPTGVENQSGIAVDGSRNRFYVITTSGIVNAFDTDSGALLETIQPGGAARDITFDEAGDILFVSVGSGDSGVIKEFPGLPSPKVTTGEPTGNAQVSGSVDPDGAGQIVDCYFEFALSAAEPEYGSVQDCTESLPITTAQTVHADLPGLANESTYHYRLVVENAGGAVRKGDDKTILPHNVQVLKTEAATEINRTSARLNASYLGTNQATDYYFEYGTSTSYGSRFPVATELTQGPTTETTQISALVSALQPDTAYHFRVVAKNSLGTTIGQDLEFKTPLAVNAVTTDDATDLTRTSATLNGSYDGATNDTPAGPLEDFQYHFEWGQTTSYGNSTPVANGGALAGTVEVSAPISGLAVQLPTSQPYHYRLVVSNSKGTSYGADHTFKTAPPLLPVISGTEVVTVERTAASFTARINPGEGPTVYMFEYGTSGPLVSIPATGPLPGDLDDHVVSVDVGGLKPGTRYRFRAVAINFTGTARGPELSFTTPDAPKIETAGVSSTGQTSARLTASVIANGSPTSVHFQYGPSASYGTGTAAVQIGSDLFSRGVAGDATGLAPGTTYHFRVVAANAAGTSTSPDMTFTTAPARPGPAGTAAGEVQEGVRQARRQVREEEKEATQVRAEGEWSQWLRSR